MALGILAGILAGIAVGFTVQFTVRLPVHFSAAVSLGLPAALAQSATPAPGPALSGADRQIVLKRAPARIVDGDTFEADLDGDGVLVFPRERVRLLYVDTAEIHESGKGVDLALGLPAREFLREAAQPPLLLQIRGDEAVGIYGRTLAELFVAGHSVNLALVRAGHSVLMTRYVLPPNLADYEAAEAEAYSARRGLWGDEDARRKALARLHRSGRSVTALDNPHYHAAEEVVGGFDPAALDQRYLRVRARLLERRPLSKGAVELILGAPAEAGQTGARLQAVAFRQVAEREAVASWPLGAPLRVAGFLKRYRGAWELVLHHRLLPEG